MVAPGQRVSVGGYDVRVLQAAHGDDTVLYDVATDSARLLYATDTGPLPEATVEAVAGARFDVVLLEETFGDKADHGTDHLHLATFADQLRRLREVGAVTDGTDVVAVHLSHHNPPTAELARRLADWGARVVDDGTSLSGATPAAARPTRTLVLGGARSGKSREAERLLLDRDDVTYVATAYPADHDDEWSERVRLHQASRPAAWSTLETLDLVALLRADGGPLLVDCFTLWLTRVMDAHRRLGRRHLGGECAEGRARRGRRPPRRLAIDHAPRRRGEQRGRPGRRAGHRGRASVPRRDGAAQRDARRRDRGRPLVCGRPGHHAVNALRLAFGTLTVLPVRPPSVDRGTAGRAMVLAPLVGLVLGLVACLPLLLTESSPLLSAVLTVGAVALLTRGLHLDGLADTADGLGSGRPASDALAVMRKGDVGPFGVVTLVIVLLAQVAALAQLVAAGDGAVALVTALVVSRLALPLRVPSWRPGGSRRRAGRGGRRLGVAARGSGGGAAHRDRRGRARAARRRHGGMGPARPARGWGRGLARRTPSRRGHRRRARSGGGGDLHRVPGAALPRLRPVGGTVSSRGRPASRTAAWSP